MSLVDVSLKAVLTIFDPERSPALNNVTWVLPSGEINTALRSARLGAVMLSWAVRSAICSMSPRPVTGNVEVRVDADASGIAVGSEGVTAATGEAPVCAGLIRSDQLLSVPVLPVAILVIFSFQVPLTLWPINVARPVESFVKNVPV